jgi:hypothetical protein
MNALASLRPFAQGWRAVAATGERCGVCAQSVEDGDHEHLADLERRALVCACRACAQLFADPTTGRTAAGARYRVVPKRVRVDPALQLDEEQWTALHIPVRLAFVYFNSALARWVALYPSPAGAAESALSLEALDHLALTTPLVGEAQPDVEALLIYGAHGKPFEVFLVPIDDCYRLVGRVRLHWTGFHGGDRAWQEIAAWFSELRARARPIRGAPAAPEDGA